MSGRKFIAGLTTFVTMAYVIFVNPNTLEASGMDKGAVFVATILAAIIGTLIMDWWQTFRMPKLREWGLTHSLHTPLFWDRDLPAAGFGTGFSLRTDKHTYYRHKN